MSCPPPISAAALALVLVVAGCARPGARSSAPSDLPPELREFQSRVVAYDELAGGLAKPPPDKATPEQIAVSQADLATGIRGARPDARQGDLLTPDATRKICAIVRHQMARGAVGRDAKTDLQEDNPGQAKVEPKVNATYPPDLPLGTVPPLVLRELPPLPAGVEYRFAGRDLILHDSRANLIIDHAPGCLSAPAAKKVAARKKSQP